MEYKTCTACAEHKPVAEFYKAKRGKFGVSAICKVCDKAKYERTKDVQLAIQRKRYADNPEFYIEKARQYAEAHKEELAVKSSIRHKERRLANHEEALLKDAEYRVKNADKISGYKKKYAEENEERLKESRKEYYLADRDANIKKSLEWHQSNPEKSRVIKRRWAIRNPDKVAVSRLRRRNIKKQCVPKWADTEWDTFLVKEICDLARLRTEVTGFPWHVDHKVPLLSKFVCGLHCADNLQAIPAKINLAKSNLIWEDMP